jgi:oleate hydratase
VHLRDGKEIDLPVPEILRQRLVDKMTSNEIGELLVEYGLVEG